MIDIKKNDETKFFTSIKRKEYNNTKFAIIRRNCDVCGLFSFYIVNLGFIHKYLLEGYVPIIDIKHFPNVLNGFNTSKPNYWETFFKQPFNYTLEEVLQKAKNIVNITFDDCWPRPDFLIFYNSQIRNFWYDFANKYLPIKEEIIDLSKKIRNKLFKDSKNILGVLTRGTDYIALRPKGHPIPPNVSDLIKDVKEMDDKYKYDYIFFTTEDERFRKKFTNSFPKKIKQLRPKIRIDYDYSKKNYINNNSNIQGNEEFIKIYLLNVIILSECLDLITARCSAAIGSFVLTTGYRHLKIYELGEYS